MSRNSTHHTHYVQGVAYDPLGVYVASQGSDRTVGVWSRKKNAAGGGGGGKYLSSFKILSRISQWVMVKFNFRVTYVFARNILDMHHET